MRHRFLASLLVVFLFSGLANQVRAQYNNWAVGFRLGEPSGLNVRKYFGDTHAFDVNVGTYGGLYGTTRDYRRGEYRTVGLSVQGHYLWHDRLFGKENARGYYGFGGQINSRRYYPDNLRNQATSYVTETSLGGSAVAGVEYFLANKPLSIFAEAGLYAELLPVPLYFNLQTGLGVRYNF